MRYAGHRLKDMVAKVNKPGSAATSTRYFEREGGYYARNDPEHRKASRWHGAGEAAVGLRDRIGAKLSRSIPEGKVPNSDSRLGRCHEGEREHDPGLGEWIHRELRRAAARRTPE